MTIDNKHDIGISAEVKNADFLVVDRHRHGGPFKGGRAWLNE